MADSIEWLKQHKDRLEKAESLLQQAYEALPRDASRLREAVHDVRGRVSGRLDEIYAKLARASRTESGT